MSVGANVDGLPALPYVLPSYTFKISNYNIKFNKKSYKSV